MQSPESRRRRKEDRPQELLEAALSLFVEKGFAASRADEVAQRAGVSKGTLYLYYPSKEDLLKAVIRHYVGNRIADGMATLQQSTEQSCTAQLRGLLVDWWQATYDSPAAGVFKLVITEVGNFPDIGAFYLQEVVEPAHNGLARVVERGIARGEFRAVEVSAAVQSLVLPLVMACVQRHTLACCPSVHWPYDGRHFIAQHVQLVLDGLCTQPAPCGTRPPTPTP